MPSNNMVLLEHRAPVLCAVIKWEALVFGACFDQQRVMLCIDVGYAQEERGERGGERGRERQAGASCMHKAKPCAPFLVAAKKAEKHFNSSSEHKLHTSPPTYRASLKSSIQFLLYSRLRGLVSLKC